jgi:hypothetical protein
MFAVVTAQQRPPGTPARPAHRRVARIGMSGESRRGK